MGVVSFREVCLLFSDTSIFYLCCLTVHEQNKLKRERIQQQSHLTFLESLEGTDSTVCALSDALQVLASVLVPLTSQVFMDSSLHQPVAV